MESRTGIGRDTEKILRGKTDWKLWRAMATHGLEVRGTCMKQQHENLTLQRVLRNVPGPKKIICLKSFYSLNWNLTIDFFKNEIFS